jgi:ABC-type dipeptide/oligopeptide/nickel transport system permease component
VYSARRPNSKLDLLARIGSLLGLSVPNFWLGLILILLFSVNLRWLPSGGFAPFLAEPQANLRFLILPAITLGVALAAVTMRMTRSAMLEVLSQDYVRTAHAKGNSVSRTLRVHALRNALIPVVTVVGLQFGWLLGGAVVVETIFSWPGIGQLVLQSIISRDYPLVQGGVMFLAAGFILSNLVVDVSYECIDPRVRS